MGSDMGQFQADVTDRQALAQFIIKLAEDLRQHPDRWENGDLGSYLEAMAAWLEDMDGYYANKGMRVPDVPSWELLAEILQAARIYE